MATLPMDAQPGEKYVYGYNTDILGVVVEKVSGLTLAEFFQKRITGPLGLVDTQFYLPPAQKDRLAAVYAAKDDGTIERATDPKTGQGHYVEGPRVAYAGGAGLLSTARDYGRFLQMLLNGGELDGVRLLEPEDGRADDREPRRHAVRGARAPDERRHGLRPRLRGDRGRRQERPLRLRRRVRLGRRVPHELLGRPEGEARRPSS